MVTDCGPHMHAAFRAEGPLRLSRGVAPAASTVIAIHSRFISASMRGHSFVKNNKRWSVRWSAKSAH